MVDTWWHYVPILVWLGVCGAVSWRHGGQSWHFFDTGSRSLLCLDGASADRCGLHVYAAHPELQIGPLSLLLAATVTAWGFEDAVGLAEAAMALAGVVVLAVLEHDARAAVAPARRSLVRWRVLLAGVVFVPAWADVAIRFGHLDDVLALLFTTAAIGAVTRDRPTATGVLLAMATLSKPWAVAFLPLVLALPSRGRLRAAAWALVPVALVAALFLLADPQTVRAAHFAIPNAASSSLRVLGVVDPVTPSWDRPVQLGLGIGLGAFAVVRGRWLAVVMIAAAVRIMLDPSVYSYYTASLVLGTVVWDVRIRQGRVVPAWSWLAFAAVYACRYLPLPDSTLGALRLGVCVVVLAGALAVPRMLSWLIPGRPAGEPEGGEPPPPNGTTARAQPSL